jgi:hypothetical protein
MNSLSQAMNSMKALGDQSVFWDESWMQESREADGIALGRLPASVTVLPRALPVIVEAVAARLRGRTQAALAEAQGAAPAGHFKRASHAA